MPAFHGQRGVQGESSHGSFNNYIKAKHPKISLPRTRDHRDIHSINHITVCNKMTVSKHQDMKHEAHPENRRAIAGVDNPRSEDPAKLLVSGIRVSVSFQLVLC